MPRKISPATVNFKDEAEREREQKKAAAAGLSLGNYFRVCAGLDPLQHGGVRQVQSGKKSKKK